MTKLLRRSLPALSMMLSVLGSLPQAVHATPITTSSDAYQWLENRSTNTLGRAPGLRQSIGVTSVVPNGLGGTTGVAVQGGTTIPLGFSGTTAIPNEFSTTIAANPALYGAWRLDFSNGGDHASAMTPAIAAGLNAMPFVTDVRLISASVTSSSFAWSIPATALSVDAVRVNLYDHGRLNLAGTGADNVYNVTLAAGTTSFTLPPVLATGSGLVAGNLYTMEINLLDFASGVPGPQSDLRNRSRLFVDFLPTETPSVGAYLPVVSPGVGGAPPVFHFDIGSVGTDRIYIDPIIAQGYEYKTGAGNPNFASVLLPTGIGDGLYEVVLGDGRSFAVAGGTVFDFDAGGVSSFKVLGIEASAGLDASDPTAFMTGLAFTGGGAFTGTMQAIAAVPEAPTWAMLLAGASGLAWLRRRRRR